jgi:chemotaxis protein methyltransferase WspC
MSLATIATLLRQQVGFDRKIIGDRKISSAVEKRRVACHLPNVDAYLRVLQSSPQELDELVEQLVVPETWFFRDRKPFDFLVEFVRSQWLPKAGAAKLRVLSVPCSTGEEPYSIAIALLEAGLSANRFSIDAIDISRVAIAKAQRARYGKNSFRGVDWVERSRYFQAVEDKHEVSSLVRKAVKFQQGNLLTVFAKSPAKYDIIFCRNLLIYLENAVCTQILNTVHRLLLPQGLLFVGAAETAKVPCDRFVSLQQSFTFAYCKAQPKIAPERLIPPSQPEKRNAVYPRAFTAETVRLAQCTTAKQSLDSSSIALQQAKKLADAGHLEAALQRCQACLEQQRENVEAHILLGTLYQSSANDEQAEQCFRRALYLQPNSYEALMHLALIKEARGDTIATQRLQQRIEKLQHSS